MRDSSIYTAFLAVICLICCVPSLLPVRGESSLESSSTTEQHCASVQQHQDDTTVLLQGGRIRIERLGEQDIEEQTRPVEAVFMVEQPPLTKSVAPLSLNQQGDGKVVLNLLRKFRTSMLSLVSRAPSAHEAVAGRRNMGVWFIVSMILCSVIAAIGAFWPKMYGNDEKRTSLRTTDAGPATGTVAAVSGRPLSPAAAGGLTSPMPPQRFDPVRSTFQPYGSQASPFRMNHLLSPPRSPLPSLASGLPTKAPDDQLAVPMSKRTPQPLCPGLILPKSEARFGVPMLQLAQLTSEGELGIVGLSGNPLLRALVRKAGKRRSLEILMPEAGGAPRATIAPNIQGLNRPDDGVLEIRGLRGSLYGTLEMQANGTCRVIKDGETMMIIDGDTSSLQLNIRSGEGMPLASVRCSSEPFGGVDHIEIRVEPGIDIVLVLVCALAVLLLSPTA